MNMRALFFCWPSIEEVTGCVKKNRATKHEGRTRYSFFSETMIMIVESESSFCVLPVNRLSFAKPADRKGGSYVFIDNSKGNFE
jgi:hypothetical protein